MKNVRIGATKLLLTFAPGGTGKSLNQKSTLEEYVKRMKECWRPGDIFLLDDLTTTTEKQGE